MSVAVFLQTQALGNKTRAGWLVLDSLPFFVKQEGSVKTEADLFNRHGATVRAKLTVSAHEYRRYASGRFLGDHR